MPEHGFLRVVSNAELDRQAAETALDTTPDTSVLDDELARHVLDRYESFRRIRETRGITKRLIECLRTFRGEYSPGKLREISKFGGSTVFAQITALKCRGATAMLRDVYLAGERPWFVEPTPVPTLPESIETAITQLVAIEAQTLMAAGQQPDPEELRKRMETLRLSARVAARAQARDEAQRAQREIDDILVEGGFYDALRDFLLNLTIFPYAVIKGPFVERRRRVTWQNGAATVTEAPRMTWYAPSPFDIYWQSSINRFGDAEVVEVMRFSRNQLQSLRGVPGFRTEAIDNVLAEVESNATSLRYLDAHESERHMLEDREDPHINRSGIISGLEYQGTVPGRLLRTWGALGADSVPDMARDYHATVWMVAGQTIKAQLTPDPRKRHNYYMTSYERVPGSLIGRALPELMKDIQDMANASLRALNNNMGIASGPQVIINDDLVDPQEDGDELYPWKRWHTEGVPFGNSAQKPIDFYQPDSRAQELLGVYEKMSYMADEISAIPRYITGNERLGGAGRTASGLSMLMNAASKVLQSVAANIDQEVIGPMLEQLYALLLLTDRMGVFRGDEQVRVRGVTFATQRETERMRALELLQLTGNPIDMGIIGPAGRAKLLKEVADRVGLDHTEIVPDAETMAARGAGQPGLPTPGGAGLAPVPGGGEGGQQSMPNNDGAGRVQEELSGAMRGPSGQTV
jgi:hypothetical protein